MINGFKIFLISFCLSLPFWWGINIFQENTEKFFYAKISQPFQQIYKIKIPLEPIKPNLDIQVKSAISVLINSQNKQKILFRKNIDEILPIASLTKLMTALVSFKIYKLKQLSTVSEESVNQEGNSGKLNVGEKLSVEDFLNIMLIESSNDAAWVLSEGIGTKAFVDLMNIKAKKLGLEDTHFANPHGLDSSENYSTAADLAKLAYYIAKNQSRIFEITTNFNYEVLNSDNSIHHLAINGNILLNQTLKIIGGKTGWTDTAGGCMLLVVNDDRENTFINIILGAKSQEARFEEMQKLINWLNL